MSTTHRHSKAVGQTRFAALARRLLSLPTRGAAGDQPLQGITATLYGTPKSPGQHGKPRAMAKATTCWVRGGTGRREVDDGHVVLNAVDCLRVFAFARV